MYPEALLTSVKQGETSSRDSLSSLFHVYQCVFTSVPQPLVHRRRWMYKCQKKVKNMKRGKGKESAGLLCHASTKKDKEEDENSGKNSTNTAQPRGAREKKKRKKTHTHKNKSNSEKRKRKFSTREEDKTLAGDNMTHR